LYDNEELSAIAKKMKLGAASDPVHDFVPEYYSSAYDM